MNCKDYSVEELSHRFENGYSLAYYITEMEAYAERVSIPQAIYNDLPGCPFAKKEVTNNAIQYYFGDFKGGITEEHLKNVKAFSDNPEKATLFYICLDISGEKFISLEDGTAINKDFGDKLMDQYPEFHNYEKVLSFLFINHVADTEFAHVNMPHFSFFFIQSAKSLLEGEDLLRAQGYYDKLDVKTLALDNWGYKSYAVIDK